MDLCRRRAGPSARWSHLGDHGHLRRLRRALEAPTVKKENPGGRRAFCKGATTVSNRLSVVQAVLGDAAYQAGLHYRGVAHDYEQAAADFELALEALVVRRQRAR